MRDLLVGGDVTSKISDSEPFIMQLPSTLPIEANKVTDLNSLME